MHPYVGYTFNYKKVESGDPTRMTNVTGAMTKTAVAFLAGAADGCKDPLRNASTVWNAVRLFTVLHSRLPR